MSMDVSTARALLPCYVCGDIDEQVGAELEALLARHPDLQAEAAYLRSAESVCREALAQLAGQLPGDGAAVRPAPVGPPALPLRHAVVSLLAAAAALALVVLGTQLLAQRPPVDGLLAQHAPFAAESAPGFVHESDPQKLSAALIAAGISPAMAGVADLRSHGLELVGGGLATGDRPGTVVVYTDGQRRYVCQMYAAPGPTALPIAARDVDGRLLRAYEADGLSVVVWEELGMVCLFSAQAPADTLLAMVEAKIRGHG